MEEGQQIIDTGLRGVTVASTRISDVDGKAGKLIYRGYLVNDLAQEATFEEIAHLLLYEALPNRSQLSEFKKLLASERHLPDPLIAALRNLPVDALPMDVLQAATSMLAAFDPDARVPGKESGLRMAVRLVAKMATILAAWHRIRTGHSPVAPDPELDHAANFLHMLNGLPPAAETARYFDVALVLHAEHSFNASTFSARQVASTRAHMYAAVAAAIGSLSGELHGGANVRVMEMLKEIGDRKNIDRYVQDTLDDGRLIFGLGHAVYKTDDPRAKILAPMAKETAERNGNSLWFDISRDLEIKAKEAFLQRKNLEIFTNVDFYSASLYDAMGIPLDLFTPVFAISRVSGWAAHVLEEQFAGAAPKPALYRPESEYIGEYCGPEECTFVPVEDR